MGHVKRSGLLVLVVFLCSSYIILPFFGPKRGFDALAVYDYFKARKVFLKKVKAYPIACNYGLSVISERKDNPFHDIDSAFAYVKRAEDAYRSCSEQRKVKALRFEIDKTALETHKLKIQETAWQGIRSSDSTAHFVRFIRNFGYSVYLDSAVNARNSLIFKVVREEDSQEAYSEFVSKYPNAIEAVEARNRLDEAVYRDVTEEGDVNSYMAYLKHFPTGPFTKRAEDKVFALSTPRGTAREYESFIQGFPKNRNVKDAWRKLYLSKTKGAGVAAIEAFRKNYPEYPFMNELDVDLEALGRELYAFSENDQWGFMDRNGTIQIQASFDWVEQFVGVQAIVGKGDLAGTIDKGGGAIIPIKYDNIEEISDEYAVALSADLYGLIDRFGKVVVPFNYDFLALPAEGLVLAERDGKYGFLDEMGRVRIPFDFSDAQSFKSGKAIVQKGDKYGMIDENGQTVVPFLYDYIDPFNASVTRARKGDAFVLVDQFGKEQEGVQYTFIGLVSEFPLYTVNSDKKVGFIDSTGAYVIDPFFDATPDDGLRKGFINGYAIVRRRAGKVGLIDPEGQQVLPFQYDFIGEVNEGLVAVSKNGQEFYYVDVNEVSRINRKFYREARPFNQGYAQVRTFEGNSGFLYKDGSEILYDSLDVVSTIGQEYVIVEGPGQGVLLQTGEVLLNPIYDKVSQLGRDLWMLELDGHKAYYRSDTKKFIWIETGFPIALD